MVKAIASVSSSKVAHAKVQPKPQTATENRSRYVLGPVNFELSDLRIEGTANPFPMPSPEQSGSVIAADEIFRASLNICFSKSPLSALLMCLGTQITVNFHFEGQGRQAAEFDAATTLVTEKDEFAYEVEVEGLPIELEMPPGLYKVSATVEVGPAQHECSQFVLGYGYMSEFLLQVHPAI